MFHDAFSFNQPMGDWDVSNVFNMGGMFSGAIKFNQPIGDWDVSNVTKHIDFARNSNLQEDYRPHFKL